MNLQDDPRRDRILESAMRMFLAQGYDGTNIEVIANAAGVSKVTIYQIFGDKEGLVSSVMQAGAQAISASCRQVLDQERDLESVLTKVGERYLAGMLRMVGDRPFYEITRLLLDVSYRHPHITHAWHDALVAGIQKPFQGYIQSQIERGTIVGKDAAFLAFHFFQTLMYSGAAIIAPQGSLASAPQRQDISDFVARKVRLFLRGCGADQTPK